MTDEIDRAQERAQFFLDAALDNNSKQRLQQEQPLFINGKRHCCGCREKLPRERLKANPKATRCVECQTTQERKNKQKGLH